jgi:hypothetical protein
MGMVHASQGHAGAHILAIYRPDRNLRATAGSASTVAALLTSDVPYPAILYRCLSGDILRSSTDYTQPIYDAGRAVVYVRPYCGISARMGPLGGGDIHEPDVDALPNLLAGYDSPRFSSNFINA